jgi:WXG100 family type VII secretion target
MATQIKITPEELRRMSRELQSDSDTVRGITNRINSHINNLWNTWDGAAQDTFLATYESNYKQLLTEDIPELLIGLSQQLTGVADTLEQTDQDLASQLKG